jgi:hypothetical protein
VLTDRIGEATPPALAALLPVRPTTTRAFTRNARLRVFLRVVQGRALPIAPVEIGVQVLDTSAAVMRTESRTFAAEDFGESRSADYDAVLPLDDLPPGLYVLSITGRRAGAAAVRRDVVFRVE